jgi:4-amino-4-deoxy-L-arabinose transferase-like glycosyltransferase
MLAALCLDLSTDEDRISGAAIGAVLGLSFLTKGPVGVALPLLIMLAGRTASGRRVMPSLRGVLSATAAWAVVVLPWGVAFLESVGFGTATATIRHEVFERAFGGTAHVEPAWYYAKIVAVGCLPWSGPVVLSAARLVRRRQDKIARTAVYSATGLLTGLLFFSLSKGKLPNYLLPLMPLASLLVTFELGQEMWEPRRRKLGSILLSATMLLLSLFLGFAGPGAKDPASVTAALAGAIVFGAGAVAALAGVVLHRPRITYGSAAIAMTLFLAAALSSLPRILSANSAARLVETTPALASGRPVVVLDRELPSLTFYLDRVPEKDTSEQVEARMALGDDPLFVISDRNFEDMPETLRIRLREVGKAGHLRVLEQVPSTP